MRIRWVNSRIDKNGVTVTLRTSLPATTGAFTPLRRRLLQAAAGSAVTVLGSPAAAVQAGRALQFPQDMGAHPDSQTEWWYLTGHARGDGRDWGFQITFFRSRVAATQALKSRFAAKHLVFAHAALTDVQGKRFWHDQRIARSAGLAGFDGALAEEGDTRVRLGDWSLTRDGGDGRRTPRYLAKLGTAQFALDLQLTAQQAPLLQGQQGWSRKGPGPEHVSGYYSEPQLAVSGKANCQGRDIALSTGSAWLDHEWSDTLMPPGAVGWDWLGMNLFDGSALTAFRLRDAKGNPVWDGGSFRGPMKAAGQSNYIFSRGETDFKPQRHWTSPHSGAKYPVEWLVRTPADFYTVRALVDDQELDSRSSTGAIYWEGLSDLLDSQGRPVGRGYLEMTGYAKPLTL